jgi:hypothetical protein
MQASFVEIADSPKKKNDEEFGSSVTECNGRDMTCRILGVSSHVTDVLLQLSK